MSIIMGTAGHIDHGKTTLIKALCGTDCDRLKDEKKRGITIELGFAFLDLLNEKRIGIVDVPGHEKFVKNMVAGASGIDFVLLTIAADEGIMPQTQEHLEICSLLGITEGIVALTKTDVVEQELLEIAQEEVQEFLSQTFLNQAPIIPVSAHTRQGIDILKKALQEKIHSIGQQETSDIFRLPIDRIFTMRGHGTVITGTLLSGTVHLGDTVRVYPGEKISKVRGLQVHGSQVETASFGQRTAVNLSSLEVEHLSRGDCLAYPETLFPSQRWDIELTCLSSSPKPLKHRKEIHFHHGTREILARIYLLDREQLNPGETALCQVIFPKPMVGVYGDRFVIRSFSPLRTIAGGKILNPYAQRIKRFSNQINNLEDLRDSNPETLLISQLRLGGINGLNFNKLQVLLNCSQKRLSKLLNTLTSQQEIISFDKENPNYVLADIFSSYKEDLVGYIGRYHSKNPLHSGISRGMITSDWGKDLPPKFLHRLVEMCIKEGKLVADQDLLHLPEHKITLASNQSQLKQEILKIYEQSNITPPNLNNLLDSLKTDKKEALPVLRLLTEEGKLVKVKEDMYFSSQAIELIKKKVEDYFQNQTELSPLDFKSITGLSRKFSIPLLEYLDKAKITIRVGDIRRLRRSK